MAYEDNFHFTPFLQGTDTCSAAGDRPGVLGLCLRLPRLRHLRGVRLHPLQGGAPAQTGAERQPVHRGHPAVGVQEGPEGGQDIGPRFARWDQGQFVADHAVGKGKKVSFPLS